MAWASARCKAQASAAPCYASPRYAPHRQPQGPCHQGPPTPPQNRPALWWADCSPRRTAARRFASQCDSAHRCAIPLTATPTTGGPSLGPTPPPKPPALWWADGSPLRSTNPLSALHRDAARVFAAPTTGPSFGWGTHPLTPGPAPPPRQRCKPHGHHPLHLSMSCPLQNPRQR